MGHAGAGRAGAAVHHTPAPRARGYSCTPTVWGLWCPLGAFTGWEGCGVLLQEAGLCSLCWSWEDPEGSRRNDDPSCASDPDGDIFKQGIKIDSGWRRALAPSITVKGAGRGSRVDPSPPPHPAHPSPHTLIPPPWMIHPGLLLGWILCHHLRPGDCHPAQATPWPCRCQGGVVGLPVPPRKCCLMHQERMQAPLAAGPGWNGDLFQLNNFAESINKPGGGKRRAREFLPC